jgi:prophage antirepressor-like protein/predicted GIY-YIG superfamily endonuclease
LEEKTLLDKYNRLNNYINIGEQIINYEEKLIKYVYDDKGNVYFRGKDLCNILEYVDSDQAIRKLLAESQKIKYDSLPPRLEDGSEGIEDGNTIYINETGLFKLIIKSKKPEAEKFIDWICEDVLPSIRKYGYYKLTNVINISEYLNCCCMYIFNVKKNIYKYGITKNIRKRLNSHYSKGLLHSHKNIIKIYKVNNYSQLMELENKFKKYCYDKNINYKLDSNIELFKSDDINNELNIINEIKNNICLKHNKDDNNLLLDNKVKNELIKMNKQIEVINKNIIRLDKEIELEKLKQKSENIKEKGNNIDKTKVIKKCKDCNSNISKRSKRCIICENKYRFLNTKSKRPSYKQLLIDKEELKYNTRIGKKYNVSDNAVRKWFKLYEKYKKN